MEIEFWRVEKKTFETEVDRRTSCIYVIKLRNR